MSWILHSGMLFGGPENIYLLKLLVIIVDRIQLLLFHQKRKKQSILKKMKTEIPLYNDVSHSSDTSIYRQSLAINSTIAFPYL